MATTSWVPRTCFAMVNTGFCSRTSMYASVYTISPPASMAC